ncbi:MAG: TniQ family protein [Chlorobia bacterium]|nr:TniQ family protein [Fimbriimonadaceae bacterium]
MRVLVLPSTNGLGTQICESLLSIVVRTAEAYRVTPFRLGRLAVGVGRNAPIAHGSANGASGYISCSDTTQWLVAGLQMLSGRNDLASTTLLKLRPVFGPKAHGIVSPAFRICPVCVDEKSGVQYGLFAHQLLHVTSCPIHAVTLLEHCRRCGAPFSNRYGPMQRHCLKCSAAIWPQRAEAKAKSHFGEWAQRQALDLVTFATEPSTEVPEAWNEQYCHAITRLSEGLDGRYTRTERLLVRGLVEHKNVLTTASPGMKTLLRLAAMQATTVVDYVRAPVENSSPRLLNIGGAKDVRLRRRSVAKQDWDQIRRLLETLLGTDEYVLLPSKRALLAQTDLAVSGLWQHDPLLAVRYEQERKRRSSLFSGKAYRCAIEGALALVKARRECGKEVHIRRDGAMLMAQKKIPKHAAERALHAALVSHDIFGELGGALRTD